MAWLLALAKPTLSWFSISFTLGNFAFTIATELSTEWLSTTKISPSTPRMAFCADASACSKNAETL